MVSLLYKNLSTSRGAGNPFHASLICLTADSGIETYLPREGPETDKSHQTPPTTIRIDTYLPREGPETHLFPIKFRFCVSKPP